MPKTLVTLGCLWLLGAGCSGSDVNACSDDPESTCDAACSGSEFTHCPCGASEICFPTFNPSPQAVCVPQDSISCRVSRTCSAGFVCVVEGFSCCGSEAFCLEAGTAACVCDTGSYFCLPPE